MTDLDRKAQWGAGPGPPFKPTVTPPCGRGQPASQQNAQLPLLFSATHAASQALQGFLSAVNQVWKHTDETR